MATTTTRGFRKPDPTDKVKDGAGAIDNLADDVDSLVGIIKHGRATFAGLVVNTPTSITVHFAHAYPTGLVPDVSFGLRSTTPQGFAVGVSSESESDFTMTVTRLTGGAAAATVGWIAAG